MIYFLFSLGTTELTDPSAPIGHGIGTKGFQYIKDRRGNLKWGGMWSYGIPEDYKT